MPHFHRRSIAVMGELISQRFSQIPQPLQAVLATLEAICNKHLWEGVFGWQKPSAGLRC